MADSGDLRGLLEETADAIEPYASTRLVLSDKNQRAFLWALVDRLRAAADEKEPN